MICIDGKLNIDLTEAIFLTKETETEEFKQYAYVWEHFDKKQFSNKNESHRKMYLSSLLNAKSAFFEILGKQENEDNVKIARPKTIVFARETPFVPYEGASSWVTVKEGGWCSTGGKQVHKMKIAEVQGFLNEVTYTGIVVQNYIPSILFYQQGISLHGHIRKASVVKRNWDVVHAGFVLKSIAQEKGNSSGYKSHLMYFDESGTFIFGKEIGGNGELYTRLIDVNLVTAIDLPFVFSQVKYEWLKAMYAINKFIQQEKIEDFAFKMVKSGKISERYLINTK